MRKGGEATRPPESGLKASRGYSARCVLNVRLGCVMDEKEFKKHLQDPAHGRHHPEEHDWTPESKLRIGAEPVHTKAGMPKTQPNADPKARSDARSDCQCVVGERSERIEVMAPAEIFLIIPHQSAETVRRSCGCIVVEASEVPTNVKGYPLR
jgi:hypothetical protein